MCKISTDPLNMCSVKTLSVLVLVLFSCGEEPKPPNADVQLLCASRLLCRRTDCSPHSVCPQTSASLGSLREQGNITPPSILVRLWTLRSLSGTTDTPLPLLRTHSSAGHRLRGTRTPNTGGFQLCPLKLAALPPAGVVGTESPPDDTRHRHRARSTGAWRCPSPHRKRSPAEQRLPQRLFPTGMSPRTGGVWRSRACAGPPPARPAPGIGRGRRGGGGGDAAPASRRRSPSAARPSLNTPGRGARSSRELPGAASRARGSGSGCRGTAPPGARPAAAYAGAAGPGEPWTAAAAGCRPPWRRTRRS